MKHFALWFMGASLLAARLHAASINLLHSFGTPLGDTGVEPAGGVVASPDGTLYGTASEGGLNNYGVVYKQETNGYNYAIWNFANSGDGAYPAGNLVLSGNTLYGTSLGGSGGTVFKVNTDGSGFATAPWSFSS